jgi:hypothetical protein
VVAADRPVNSTERIALVRREGEWKIRHLHSSGKKL